MHSIMAMGMHMIGNFCLIGWGCGIHNSESFSDLLLGACVPPILCTDVD